jgi:hypothetical protein
MAEILTLLIVALLAFAAWRDRQALADGLEAEWMAFLEELL